MLRPLIRACGELNRPKQPGAKLMSRQPNSVQRDTYIRANYNKKKIKQPDFPAEAPESNSYKYEAGNAERSMHDLSCESPKECFPESYDRTKSDGSTNQAEKRSAHGVFQA
jgi:hypothetical protein